MVSIVDMLPLVPMPVVAPGPVPVLVPVRVVCVGAIDLTLKLGSDSVGQSDDELTLT